MSYLSYNLIVLFEGIFIRFQINYDEYLSFLSYPIYNVGYLINKKLVLIQVGWMKIGYVSLCLFDRWD